MAQVNRPDHEVTLSLYNETDDAKMCSEDLLVWLERHFKGCDYARVRVEKIKTGKRPPIYPGKDIS